ncbi:MAG: hypothetical protein ACXW06_06510 [Halobacteriota archaeon]
MKLIRDRDVGSFDAAAAQTCAIRNTRVIDAILRNASQLAQLLTVLRRPAPALIEEFASRDQSVIPTPKLIELFIRLSAQLQDEILTLLITYEAGLEG